MGSSTWLLDDQVRIMVGVVKNFSVVCYSTKQRVSWQHHCCVTVHLYIPAYFSRTVSKRMHTMFLLDVERTHWSGMREALSTTPLLLAMQGTQNVDPAWSSFVAGSLYRNPLQARAAKANHHTSQQQSLDNLRLTQAVLTKTSPLHCSQTIRHNHDLASLLASPKAVQHYIQTFKKSKIGIHEAAARQTFYTGWRQQHVVAQGKGSRKD